MKKLGVVAIFLFSLLTLQPAEASKSDQESVFELLQEGFAAQVSLFDKHRTKEEIEKILSPYFTDDYIKLFLEAHLFKEEEGYILLGTDVFTYFVPFFSYTDQTKLNMNNQTALVSEFFAASNEGGVVWKDHYESLKLTKTAKGWKISGYQMTEERPNHLNF